MYYLSVSKWYGSITMFHLITSFFCLIDKNDSRIVLDAFFLGKAFAEALNERIESTVGEILSVVGQWQAEQQKQVQDFQVSSWIFTFRLFDRILLLLWLYYASMNACLDMILWTMKLLGNFKIQIPRYIFLCLKKLSPYPRNNDQHHLDYGVIPSSASQNHARNMNLFGVLKGLICLLLHLDFLVLPKWSTCTVPQLYDGFSAISRLV